MGYFFFRYLVYYLLVVALLTISIIFLSKRRWKKSMISGSILIMLFIIVQIMDFAGRKKEVDRMNSWKSKDIQIAEKQYAYLAKQSDSKVNKFVKNKLRIFKASRNITEIESRFSAEITFSDSAISEIEHGIKKALVLYLKAENEQRLLEFPEGYNKEPIRKIKSVRLELVVPQGDDMLVILARVIIKNSSTSSVKCFLNRQTKELGVVESYTCERSENRTPYDIKDVLTYYSSLKGCELDLRSQCEFWAHSDYGIFNSGDLQIKLIDDLPFVFLIDGKKYPTYRIFDWNNSTRYRLKPTKILK